jgi:hypothetical protein
MKRVGCVAVWTAALLVTNFGAAMAQTQAAPQNMPEGPMMASGSGMPMMGGPGRMGMMIGMADHIEGRIAFLKAELNIADALRQNARRMSGTPAMMMMQGGTMSWDGASVSAPDRVDRMEKMLMTMLEIIVGN